MNYKLDTSGFMDNEILWRSCWVQTFRYAASPVWS